MAASSELGYPCWHPLTGSTEHQTRFLISRAVRPSFKPPSPNLFLPDLRQLPLDLRHWAHHLFPEMAGYQLVLSGEKKKKRQPELVPLHAFQGPISSHVSIPSPSCQLHPAGPCHQRGPLRCPSSQKRAQEPGSELALSKRCATQSCLTPTCNRGAIVDGS